MSPALVGLLAFVLVAAAYTFFGWRCFTGRTVFWLRHPTFIDAWWPAGLYIGGALFVLSVGVLATYLLEEVVAADAAAQQPLRVIAGIGLGVGILSMLFLVLALGPLLWIEDTFRRKPNGTRLARLLLPAWYREELRRRVAEGGPARGGASPDPRGPSAQPLHPPPPPRPPSGPSGRSAPPPPPPPQPPGPRNDRDEPRGGVE